MWQNFVGDVVDRVYDVIALISKSFIIRRLGVAIFADIIKILTMFIKAIYKDSRKFETNRN